MSEGNQMIAEAYGFPYLFEMEGLQEIEETALSVKRIGSIHNAVTKWIEKHRRIPSDNPKASPEERKMGIWLKVVMFFKDIMLDPTDETEEERSKNEKIHQLCQQIIRRKVDPELPLDNHE